VAMLARRSTSNRPGSSGLFEDHYPLDGHPHLRSGFTNTRCIANNTRRIYLWRVTNIFSEHGGPRRAWTFPAFTTTATRLGFMSPTILPTTMRCCHLAESHWHGLTFGMNNLSKSLDQEGKIQTFTNGYFDSSIHGQVTALVLRRTHIYNACSVTTCHWQRPQAELWRKRGQSLIGGWHLAYFPS